MFKVVIFILSLVLSASALAQEVILFECLSEPQARIIGGNDKFIFQRKIQKQDWKLIFETLNIEAVISQQGVQMLQFGNASELFQVEINDDLSATGKAAHIVNSKVVNKYTSCRGSIVSKGAIYEDM